MPCAKPAYSGKSVQPREKGGDTRFDRLIVTKPCIAITSRYTQVSRPEAKNGTMRASTMCALGPISDQMRALVVDDDENQRTDLAEMVASFGITPLTAADGQEAIDKLDSCNVDVIVTDLMMPGMDGFGLLRHLAQHGN